MGEAKFGRVLCKSYQHSATQKKGKWESICSSKVSSQLRAKQSPASSAYQSMEVPKGPLHAMEFLCRSWSPSASDFHQILQSNNIVQCLEEKYAPENVVKHFVLTSRFFLGPKEPPLKHYTVVSSWLQRLLAWLPRAVFGGTQNNQQITHRDQVAGDQNVGVVFALAAALVATVCAKAAESAGAHRAHVASAINSSLAAQTSTDMVALTATAATSKFNLENPINFHIVHSRFKRSRYTQIKSSGE
ncbi:VAN3-binding protein-like, auxin canalization domain [Dillenia turbinata]|uniref:VAN3-binding protein-like, auxin canalization domain n=1 Tax=Dillenia turbinata TaxID=194707 RepID=A0AAN8ZFT8_9MAGN